MKAVIIGSGIAGIAGSIRLAKKGYAVEIFEANDYPGGKLSQFEQDGYRFDAGPSLFTMPHLVDELFELAGEDPKDHFDYHELDHACNYFWEDGTRLTAWTDQQQFSAEVAANIGVNGTTVKDYLAHSRKLFDLTSGTFLEKSLHKASTYFSADVLKTVVNIFSLDLMKSMNQANEKRLGHPKLVQLFNRFATYNGSDPYLAPGVLNIIPHLEHNMGTFFPVGGMYAITQSLYKLAQKLGVQFRFGQPVEKIEVRDKRATGIWVNGSLIEADLVVSNMDIVPTYRKLLPGQKAPEKTLNQERSSSALIFYWGIDRGFPELSLHNIFFSDDYKTEFDHIFRSEDVFDDPTVYVHVSSTVEKEDAPEGCQNWFVMVNVPGNKGQDWDAIIKKTRKNILSKLDRMLGVKVADHITTEATLDPRTIEARTSSYQGSLYGASSNNRFSAFLRHPNFTSKIKNLYFLGGSVHPGGGIPLCLLSAKIVADLTPAP